MTRWFRRYRSLNRPYVRPYHPYLFILPGLLLYAVFVLLPMVNTVRYSFTEWSGFDVPVFNGGQNYADLLRDGDFWNAIGHNAFFVIFYTILPILIGLFLSSVIARSRVKGMAFFRTGLFLPYVMSPVVVGVIWRWLFSLNGPINQLLATVGLGAAARPWLGDFDFARPAVGVVGTWVMYGLCMVLFIAGIQGIDEDLYDAAKVFGANAWGQFRYVTLPGLRQQLLVAFVVTFIAAMRVFDLVFVLTGAGGPGKETVVASVLIYQQAFQLRKAGYASAIAVVLTALILVVSALVNWSQSRAEGES
jgi:raffinose/stachyose/melibiose transport system permease protein